MTTAGRAGDEERVEALVAIQLAHVLQYGPNLGQICSCGYAPTKRQDPAELLTQQDIHRAHLAQQIAALVRNDLAAFLAELPADVFSERVIGLIREWADEWRTGGGEG